MVPAIIILFQLEQNLINANQPLEPDEDNPLRLRIISMIWDHGYTVDEASKGMKMEPAVLLERMNHWHILPENKPQEKFPPRKIKVLPWEPGRHPRIGFLEGAVDPRPDTKISIFLPWESSGYVVFDVPEAVFSNLGLIWLAHKHIPTIWDEKGIERLEVTDWVPYRDGGLMFARTLPNKISFGVNVEPGEYFVTYEYWLRNGTDQTLTGLRSQLCVLLKNAPDFNDQTGDNKILGNGTAAVRSRDGKRWIITECERSKPWQNPPCPCMHADPTFEDCPPGARVSVRGRIWFHEGETLPESFH